MPSRLGETVTISGWNGREAVNLDQIIGGRSVLNVSPPGRINPAHCTATGKVFLAYLTEDRDHVMDSPLERFTPKTITSKKKLLTELQKVLEEGYAVNEQEFDIDISSIAAPVFNSSGIVSYVVAVTIPHFRYNATARTRLVAEIVGTARHLSGLLGYAPEHPVSAGKATPAPRVTQRKVRTVAA